jgi:hypothetical protein
MRIPSSSPPRSPALRAGATVAGIRRPRQSPPAAKPISSTSERPANPPRSRMARLRTSSVEPAALPGIGIMGFGGARHERLRSAMTTSEPTLHGTDRSPMPGNTWIVVRPCHHAKFGIALTAEVEGPSPFQIAIRAVHRLSAGIFPDMRGTAIWTKCANI